MADDNETADGLNLQEFDGAEGVPAALPMAAFVLDWGDGRAAFDPEQAAARVAEALSTALAAEGLHAEPLIPGGAPAGDDPDTQEP